jgi:hypothetical protein
MKDISDIVTTCRHLMLDMKCSNYQSLTTRWIYLLDAYQPWQSGHGPHTVYSQDHPFSTEPYSAKPFSILFPSVQLLSFTLSINTVVPSTDMVCILLGNACELFRKQYWCHDNLP